MLGYLQESYFGRKLLKKVHRNMKAVAPKDESGGSPFLSVSLDSQLFRTVVKLVSFGGERSSPGETLLLCYSPI